MEHEVTVHDFHKITEGTTEAGHQKICVLDVREHWESETASLPGSHLIPMSELPARAHAEIDKDAHVIVYCHHGNRSLYAVMWLREQGFPHTQSLAGGIEAWSQSIDPAVPRY